MEIYEKDSIKKVELALTKAPILLSGTYKGSYGSNVVTFKDDNGYTWEITLSAPGVRGFGYPAIVHVKDGNVEYVAV